MPVPTDPIILLSYLNTKLRDDFSTLDDLCKTLCVSKEEIVGKLASVGYEYDSGRNQFV